MHFALWWTGLNRSCQAGGGSLAIFSILASTRCAWVYNQHNVQIKMLVVKDPQIDLCGAIFVSLVDQLGYRFHPPSSVSADFQIWRRVAQWKSISGARGRGHFLRVFGKETEKEDYHQMYFNVRVRTH